MLIGRDAACSVRQKKITIICMRTRRAVSLQTNKNINTIMKKTYIAPEVEEIKVNVANMMASSLGINETEVDANDEQLGREEKKISSPGVWGNEW